MRKAHSCLKMLFFRKERAMQIKKSLSFWLAMLCSLASMGFICKTDYEKMHGQTINIGELKINYKESVTSAPIAVVKLGELGGRYYWWYSSKKFVFAGNAFVAGYKIMQIGEGEMYNRMEIILTASICYEHGEFFYSERRNKRNGCLIFDPGVAAIDYLKVKFFVYSFSFIALFPFCRMGEL